MSAKLLRTQKGFSLFEIILAAAIVGMLSIILAPSVKTFLTVKDNAHRSAQIDINQRIANALISWSESVGISEDGSDTKIGTLPETCLYPGANANYALQQPDADCNMGLSSYLAQQGVGPSLVNSDGTANENVRVYQSLNSGALYQRVGLMYPLGPAVDLTYSFGVIYSTDCGKLQPCNTADDLVPPENKLIAIPDPVDASKAIPDNRWAPKPSDYGVVYVSTLPLQRRLLDETSAQVERIRSALKGYMLTMQAANPTSTVNFLPKDSAAACASGLPPASCVGLVKSSASANQGCWDGWYSLADPGSDILAQIGAGEPSLGRTAWGGSVEYCRDFDPANIGRDQPPHYGALRINKAISRGIVPDTTSASENVFITF